jgi:hypothetical protein
MLKVIGIAGAVSIIECPSASLSRTQALHTLLSGRLKNSRYQINTTIGPRYIVPLWYVVVRFYTALFLRLCRGRDISPEAGRGDPRIRPRSSLQPPFLPPNLNEAYRIQHPIRVTSVSGTVTCSHRAIALLENTPCVGGPPFGFWYLTTSVLKNVCFLVSTRSWGSV